MSFVNPDNLIAVALIINRSRDGPAFVFHYPPAVLPVHPEADFPDAADSEDMLLERLSRPMFRDPDDQSSSLLSSSKHVYGRHHHHHHPHHRDEHHMSESGIQTVPWESVAGFPTRDLASILTPARSYHKKLFQLSLDPLLCVSYPIHVPESGKWKKTKRTKTRAPSAADDDQGTTVLSRAPSIAVSAAHTSNDSDGTGDRDREKDDDDEKRSSMTMFNLVFILRPKKDQTRELVDALYPNIAKKVNKAFKYSQQHSDFVWKESKKILATKDRAREDKKRMGELWKELIQQYSLAASVHEIYQAITQNRIATLHLDTAAGVLSPSVQIPTPYCVSDLPHEEAKRARGLWLTTANAFLSQDVLDEPGFLDRNFGLLLMEDEKKIVAELQADGDPRTMPMVEFVRLSKPTMSFHQVGQSNVLSPSQVRKFAQHFIFWRRAIAIPPLHARDTYIVSPNCDLARLPEASAEWQRAFPLAPPLANFLSDMSVCPRAYKTFCPSKVHRPLYLRMLAWLVRGGWATQLCTFAYVVVWPEIIYQVDYEMEAEELDGPSPSTSPHSAAAPSSVSSVSPSSAAPGQLSHDAGGERRRGHDDRNKPDDDDVDGNDTTTKSTLAAPLAIGNNNNNNNTPPSTAFTSTSPPSDAASSPTTTRAMPPTSTPSSAALPTTTERTAEKARLERIAQRVSREAADRAAAHARRPVPETTAHPSTNRGAHLAGLAPHVILDAKRATGLESRYLAAIASRLRDRDGDRDGDHHHHHHPRARQAWPAMCRYFDGRCALERVALQEDMKRKEAWAVLTAMSEYLLCTRHW